MTEILVAIHVDESRRHFWQVPNENSESRTHLDELQESLRWEVHFKQNKSTIICLAKSKLTHWRW